MALGAQVSRYPKACPAGFTQVYLRSTYGGRVLGEEAWTGPLAEQNADAWLRKLVQFRGPAWEWPVDARVMLDDESLLDFQFMVEPRRHAATLRGAALRHFLAIQGDEDVQAEIRDQAGLVVERLSGHELRPRPSRGGWQHHIVQLFDEGGLLKRGDVLW